MSKKKRVKSKSKRSFNPDELSTEISQTLMRDLSSIKQMYGGGNAYHAYYQKAQAEAILKKYVSTSADMSGIEEETYQSFLSTNERIGRVNRFFKTPRDLPAHLLSPHELILTRAKCLMHWTLGSFSFEELCSTAQNSGGVSQGVSFADTSQEAKFKMPISTTAGAHQIWSQYLTCNELLQEAVLKENANRQEGEEYDFVEGSRATTVPKTNSKLRMIAIEPTLNMFFQQGLMIMMYRRMEKVGLDVTRLPEQHKELAWRGSITGQLATIDFSSASDCVALELLRWLLPEQWFEYIDLVRCKSMKIGETDYELNMVSTMGNAGTFPLETLVFWTLGVATVMSRTRSNPYSLLSLPAERRQVSVFGDDCILPSVDARAFISTCESVGFKVNKEKSFIDPKLGFRESCGGDYLHGSDVRPIYLSAPTSTRKSALEPWLYIILNNVLKKYISYFGTLTYVYDKALLEYLFGLFRENGLLVKLVPPYFPDDAGLKSSDWRRLRETYRFKISTIGSNSFGLLSFQYCRFQYADKKKRSELLQYALWLGRNATPLLARFEEISRTDTIRDGAERVFFPRRPLLQFPRKEKGGYIVAKGLSSCWSL